MDARPAAGRVKRLLDALGMKVSEARGAIIDACSIKSAARSHQRTVECSPKGQASVSKSVEAQARWSKRGMQSFHGYRTNVAVETEGGFHRAEHYEAGKRIREQAVQPLSAAIATKRRPYSR
ncbi:MAG: hypothetical protein AB7E55_18265 [Pigmentiphaga sp.]